MATTQFDNVYHGSGKLLGMIRFSDAGLGWKPLDEGATVTIPAEQMTAFAWLRVARQFQLKIRLKGTSDQEEGEHVATFENFQRDDHAKLEQVLRECYDKPLETIEVSTRGWNWGAADVDEHDIRFFVKNKLAFSLPLANIANSNIAGRTEVSMEFINPKDQQPEQNTGAASSADALPFQGSKKNRPDQLVEMRLYIPGQVERDEAEDEEDEKDVKEEDQELEEEEEGEEEDGEEESAALAFHNTIKAKADIGQVAGDGILVLKEVLVLTPRGRYDIDMFPSFLRLRGKTYDYKILYSSITQLFLLPKPDEVHVLFIVALDPPIRQGQTRYPFLVLQFPREEEMDAELNLDEETIQTKYEGKLKKRYEEPTFRIVTNLFRVFSQQKVHVPTGFTNSTGQECVRCNVKANDGVLYPLNRGLIWVSKQPVLISYNDVHQFVFSRVGGAVASAKTFDMRVELSHGVDHTFQSISREELDNLNHFFAERKLRVKNELTEEAMGIKASVDELLGDDDDEDESGKRRRDDDDDDDKLPQQHVFQKLQYLRKLANHPSLVLDPAVPAQKKLLDQVNASRGTLAGLIHAPKLQALRQLLLDCGIGVESQSNDAALIGADTGASVSQHRVLIFCQMKQMLDVIERDLFRALMPSVTYLRLDGSVSSDRRHGIVQSFNADPSIDILLLTTSVGGLGLTLTGADTVIFVEHDWNPMKDLQAMDRAHRLGQKKVVNVYRLITRDTLEANIMGLQQFKMNIANSVVTQQNKSMENMDTDRILDLFGPAAAEPAIGQASVSAQNAKSKTKGISQKALLASLQHTPDVHNDEEYADMEQWRPTAS